MPRKGRKHGFDTDQQHDIRADVVEVRSVNGARPCLAASEITPFGPDSDES